MVMMSFLPPFPFSSSALFFFFSFLPSFSSLLSLVVFTFSFVSLSVFPPFMSALITSFSSLLPSLLASFLPRPPPATCHVQVRPCEERPAAHHQLRVSCAGVCGAVTASPVPYLHSHIHFLVASGHTCTQTHSHIHPHSHRGSGIHTPTQLPHSRSVLWVFTLMTHVRDAV